MWSGFLRRRGYLALGDREAEPCRGGPWLLVDGDDLAVVVEDPHRHLLQQIRDGPGRRSQSGQSSPVRLIAPHRPHTNPGISRWSGMSSMLTAPTLTAARQAGRPATASAR